MAGYVSEELTEPIRSQADAWRDYARRETYFVLRHYGEPGVAFAETPPGYGLHEVVSDLIDGQLGDPICIMCARDGRWSDASERVARLAIKAADDADNIPAPGFLGRAGIGDVP